MMDKNKKTGRYQRIYTQLQGLLTATRNREARMATIAAVLHHKMDYFFWTGFYCLTHGELIVRSYQGPVACQVLKKNTGVCWKAITDGETIVVTDVHEFPGHIACDSRSRSEIVVPLHDNNGDVYGVLDIDSADLSSFDETDAEWLEKIVALV
jgi:GAF domain-containing protein